MSKIFVRSILLAGIAVACFAEPPSLAEKALRQLRAEQSHRAAVESVAERKQQLASIDGKVVEQGKTLRSLFELLERIAQRLSIRP